MSAEDYTPLSVHARSEEVPAIIASYFLGHPSDFSATAINSQEPLVYIEQYRAIRTVVLAEGWSGLEPWGVWSEGDRATLFLKNPFAEEPGSYGELVIDARAALSESHPNLTVQSIFHSARAKFAFSWPEARFSQIRLPIAAEFSRVPVLRLELEIDSPRTPHELTAEVSLDHRRLGIGVTAVEIRRAG